MFYVHNLVLEAFIGPRPAGMMGLHKDDDPTNNTPGNLYWGSHQDNADDAARNGRTARGERVGSAKLTDPEVLELFARWKAGETTGRLAVTYGLQIGSVKKIVYAENWTHITNLPKRRMSRSAKVRLAKLDPAV